MAVDIKNLHPLETRVLLSYKAGDELTVEKVEQDLAFKAGNGNQALSWLAAKGIVEEKRREKTLFYEITDLGRSWKAGGTPEERIIALVEAEPGLKLPEIAGKLGLENKDIGSAFGSLSKGGLLAMNDEKGVITTGLTANHANHANGFSGIVVVRNLLDKAEAASGMLADADLAEAERAEMQKIAKKRGAADSAFRIVEKETVVFVFAPGIEQTQAALKAAGITGGELGALTAEMLANGSWRGKTFRAYNVNTPPTRLLPGRSNPYSQFLEGVKDKLASLGFEEFDGPLVETEFWNSDALFMPQFHSARDIHDVYRIADTADPTGFAHAARIEEPWLSNVASAHENGGGTGSMGWNYHFDREFTRRLILRSQGTALSAKTLPHAKIPGKYFGIVRCFRYDQVDSTHLSDFYQTEGIVLGEDVNLRTLLGMLEMFATEVAGAKEIKYVPGYFPFTEPSVEVHIKHPVLGWFEMGGSGIFRPEVTESLGVHVPVAAWGIGIDRMALLALGISNIRELFSYDIEAVRQRRTK
ncbi:MAG: phenylalanine--tRNA ligase subunit alpha [Spirochaetaceae bacterium]|jgi:phenylalanyl-tRNA synthetase alpha chain|nr:phenylalanine--tRNA ligase subunit alpha [Spirochaetaceae bacterium]